MSLAKVTHTTIPEAWGMRGWGERELYKSLPEGWVESNQTTLSGLMSIDQRYRLPVGQRLVVMKNKAVTLSLPLSCSFHLVHEIHPPSSWVCIFFLLLYCHFSCFRNVFNLPRWAKSLPTNHFKRELVGCSLTERWGLSVTITSTLFHHLRLLFPDLKMSMKRSNCAALWEQNYPIWWIHFKTEQFSKTALILSILTSAFSDLL